MRLRKATEEDKRNLLKNLPRDRNAQIVILDCINGLTDEEREACLTNSEFIPHFTMKDHAESVFYVGDDEEKFVHEVIRRFLATRKLFVDINRVNIKRFLAFVFSKDQSTTLYEYRDSILMFSYKMFCKARQDQKEYLDKLLKEYKNVERQNTDLVQNVTIVNHSYKKMLILNNKKSLKSWIKKVKVALEEKNLRAYISRKLSPFRVRQLDLFSNDYFPPAEMFSPKVIDERFLWMQHLPAGDYRKIEITNDKSIMTKHIPGLMNGLKEYLNDSEFTSDNKNHADAIVEAIDAYKAGFKRAAITLMLRENEGLVWDLARQIAEKHNIYFDKRSKRLKMDNHKEVQEKTSLPQLLDVEDWPPIFKGPHGKLRLGERLGFLSFDYSHERNLIVHGITTDFDEDWKWFELISACITIIEVFEELNGWNEEEDTEEMEFRALIRVSKDKPKE